MAGLLTHLSVGLLGFIIIYFSFYECGVKTKIVYGLGFFIGHLAPDLTDFGLIGLKIGSLSPQVIMRDPLFHTFAVLGHTFSNWVILGIIVLLVAGILFKFKKIQKQTFVGVVIFVIFFITGTAFHLVLDSLIQEKSCWI